MKNTEGLHKAYLDNYVTVFAPTNDAMNSFHGVKDENFILHHMGRYQPDNVSPCHYRLRMERLSF